MTPTLQAVFEEAAKLSEESQDGLAADILRGVKIRVEAERRSKMVRANDQRA